jgi:hypothetical protein
MDDAVRVDVDELSKAILPVVWPNEPTFDTCCFPLSAQCLGVGDVKVRPIAAGPISCAMGLIERADRVWSSGDSSRGPRASPPEMCEAMPP